MNKLGFVNSKKGWLWLKSLENRLKIETWNNRINNSGRLCLWFGLGVELGLKNRVVKGLEISNGLRKRGNQLWGSEDWNSILVYKYNRGIELKDHIDRDIFDDKVIIINFCRSLVGFKYNNKVSWLKDGEIIKINNKVLHGIIKVNEERWSIQFRKVNY